MKNAPARSPRHHDRSAAVRPPSHFAADASGAGSVRASAGAAPQIPAQQRGPVDPHAVRRQEQIMDALLRAGLDEEQALAQIQRLEAGDIWSG